MAREQLSVQYLYVLDEATISRIKDCKRHGFPICLEEALYEIFKESAGEVLIERIVNRLGLKEQNITSSEVVWKIYDIVLTELTRDLGKDVSEVIEFQSIKEMESMVGCTHCPLYQREAMKQLEK
jgi:hypothetical protein